MDNKHNPDQKVGLLHTLGLILLTLFLVISVLIWVSQYFLFPKGFTPVSLAPSDIQALQQKLTALGAPITLPNLSATTQSPNRVFMPPTNLQFSTKELNALLGQSNNLGSKMAIELNDNQAIAALLLPLPTTLPMIGGKQLEIHADVTATNSNGQPALLLKNARVWGIPLGDSWLNGMQIIEISRALGGNSQTWQNALARIEQVQVKHNSLELRLKPQ